MQELKNNLFSFATKELSQDAVICWLLNWIKYPESELFEVAKVMFKLLGVANIDSNQVIDIKRQVNKADIIVVLHGQKLILMIEDKIFSSEHDNQIREYKSFFSDLTHQKELLGNKTDEPYYVQSVYFKTGYYYDEDKRVEADIKICAEQFFEVVSNERYRGKSEILDSYVEHLKGIMKYYEDFGDFRKRDNAGTFYISKETIAQHNFMRTIFPKEMWTMGKDTYMVKTGSSSGRPWTETSICEYAKHLDIDEKYWVFWRIDTNNDGPYLSLRIYDWFNKADSERKQKHNQLYDDYINMSCDVFEKLQGQIGIKWEEVKEGYRGNYVEASLFSVKLSDYLLEWDTKGEKFVHDINLITNEFLNQMKNRGVI